MYNIECIKLQQNNLNKHKNIIEDIKRVIRSCKLKNRQYNGQKKKENSNFQNPT